MEREVKSWEISKNVDTALKVDCYDVAGEIDDMAKSRGCGLVVLGSKGKGIIDRLLLGSVSNKLAHHGDTSLLVVR